MGQSLPIGFAWRRATKARDDLLPFSFIARPEADSWRFISRFHKARAAAADGASHMLDYIFRPTIPAVQCEPAPKKGAVHNPAMTTKGAGRGDIGILSPYNFERFKQPVHHCPIDRRRQSANRLRSEEHPSELQVTNAQLLCRLLLE